MVRALPHARPIAFSLIAAIAIALLAVPMSPATADPGNGKLGKKDRELVANAIANSASSVTLLFATAEGVSSSVVAALRSLGATVWYHDADVGYIRADVPTGSVAAAAKIPGVLAVEVDEIIELAPPAPAEGPDAAPPDATTPAQNPYMPTRDIGAPQFVAANPTYDGRGVTIGILDTGVDLDHPSLQTTTTGERKIVDWITNTHPLTDNDPTWIVMSQTVSTSGGSFTVGTTTYTGAPDGSFKFGLFNEASLGAASEYNKLLLGLPGCNGADLNRNGVCNEKFALLWDGKTRVWVDSNADTSFSGEPEMRPYKQHFDVGHFGTDDPVTAIRESVPFVVQVDHGANAVNIGIPSGAHATHVAGIAAGKDFFGPGSYDGAAPGAKIVSVRVCLFIAGCTAHALIEGMIFVTKNANVDVVNMSIGGLPSLNDGNNTRAMIYNALIDKWGAQMFISAGNSGPGVNTVGDPSVATKVVSVGATWHKDSVLANYGNVVTTTEALHDFSSRGPREDGGLKPQITAPGNAVSGVPTWQPGQCLTVPQCPPGYGMFNGTSMSAPQATGGAALLLSAAKQTDHGHKPAQLRQAMTSSARYFTNYKAHEQGFGIVDVPAAWSLLQQDVKTSDISSSVPNSTLLSGFLATPGVGTGIHDREGVNVGSSPYPRTYTFRKTDGGSGTYALSFIGNDGTFSLPAGTSTIDFSKQSTATLDVTVTPTTAGVHSALLVLDDPATVGIDYATMNTVVVSVALNASNSYTASQAATALRFEANQPALFFAVPNGTTALRNSLSITNNGRARWFRVHPFGVPIDPASTAFFTGPATQTRTTQISPLPGTWEIAAAASRASVPVTTTMTTSATAYRVTLSPASATQDPTTIGTTYTQSFTASNEFAAGGMAGTGSALGSTFTTGASISEGGSPQTYAITVGAGATQLVVEIGNPSDLQADLDLYVYNCTTGPCVLAGSGTTPAGSERVAINNPAAGSWMALVDPFAVPAGTTTYTYTDSIANPAFGSVTVADAFASRASGSSWSFNANAKANTSPGAGRFFRGTVSVRLDAANGPILGSATWDLKNVGP